MFEKIKRFAVVTGKGTSSVSRLNAVDNALIDAGIGDINLIDVSSILPRGIEQVEDFELDFGAFVPAVISQTAGEEKELMAGIGFGSDHEGQGYVVEHSKRNTDIQTEDFVEELQARLNGMAEKRERGLDSISTSYIRLKNEDRYGCAVSVLVYLP